MIIVYISYYNKGMKSLLNRRTMLTGSLKRLKKYNICYSWLVKTSKILNKYSEIKD